MRILVLLVVLLAFNLRSQAQVISCKDMNPLQVHAVPACVTSAGVTFKHLSGAWQDTGADGKVWSESRKSHLNQIEALGFCKNLGLVLPSGYPTSMNGLYEFPSSDSDFVLAEKHGIREVFIEFEGNGLFWSTSVDHNKQDSIDQIDGDTIYVYNGSFGTINFNPKMRKYGGSAVWCREP